MQKTQKRRIVVALGRPQQIGRREWRCDIRIDGLEAILKQVVGVDSLDALLLGVQAIRWSLMHSGRKLAWPDTGVPCFSGDIPRQVPTALGEEFDERLEQLIDSEAPRLLKLRKKMIRPYLVKAARTRATSHQTLSTRGGRRSD